MRRRFWLLFGFFLLWGSIILGRLFYWQILMSEKLVAAEVKQTLKVKQHHIPRGEIFADDGAPLVLNQNYYDLYLWQPVLDVSRKRLVEVLGRIIFPSSEDLGKREDWKKQTLALLEDKKRKWLCLYQGLEEKKAEKIEGLGVKGLSLELRWGRFYPEGSSSAHLLGFLGRDQKGREKGYFGLEGFYDSLLKGTSWRTVEKNSWSGRFSEFWEKKSKIKKDLVLFLDRTVQFIAEEELEKGIEKYKAKSGWVVILNPYNGGVLAMAALPKYDPATYYQWDEKLFVNPVVSTSFEPGSIMKPLIAAAALEEKVIDLESQCPVCDGPVRIGEHQIRTWNNQYHPHSTIKEIIQHSDNVGMVWVGKELGKEKLLAYLKRYGFGEKTGIDLEGEATLPLKKKNAWYPIDLATVTFGQGIAVTPIQMITSFAPLANGGVWFRPRVVKKIKVGQRETNTQPFSRRVLSKETVEEMKEILVNAVDLGIAKRVRIPEYSIAGKSGTAQIPIKGHYDEEKTIASYIGFAPADKPRFVMLVSLREPQSSPWGAATAAPVWFAIAKRLLFYYGVPPDR